MLKQLKILFVVAALLISFMTPAAAETQRILLLMSYHIGFGWHDDILKGVQDTIKNSGISYELYVEFFDTVRFKPPKPKILMDFITSEKYKNIDLDVIIVADDHGLQNVIDNKMYEKAPVVFVGVNSLRRVDEARSLGMTGVIETVEFKKTFEHMLKLHPNLERIVPVVGNSSTGQKHLKNMRVEFNQIDTDVILLEPWRWSFESLAATLKSFDPATTAIIQASFHRDYQDNLAGSIGNYTFFDQFDLPAYTMWKTSGLGSPAGHGMLGGVVSDGIVHGSLAAEKALAVLRGIDPLDIPIDSGSKINVPMFDHQLLLKFGIQPDSLHARGVPGDAVVINIPPSFYNDYYGYIWIVSGFLLIQIVATILYVILFRDRQRLVAVAKSQHRQLLDVQQYREKIAIARGKRTAEPVPEVDEVFHTLSTVLGRIKPDQ